MTALTPEPCLPAGGTLLFFSGTHWDREWYQPFQGFRYELVSVMDRMIEALESDPEFPVFHLDGQVALLPDYLAIAPEMETRLRALLASRRIRIGPWFCMPDEFLCSGEAILRNLLRGIDEARRLGADPWRFGYLCDIFGHIAQMPQILRGFGIGSAILGRGLNDEDISAFFDWRSPDGQEILAFKLPDREGYGSFCLLVIGQLKQGTGISPESPLFGERLRAYVDAERARSGDIGVVVVMDAMDHEPLHPDTSAYVTAIRCLYPDMDVLQPDFENMASLVREQAHPGSIRSLEGELNRTIRKPALFNHLLSHILSSRPTLKRRNDDCQALLERWVEPMAVLASLHGTPFRSGFLREAWRQLLLNQAHDSICGCSVDAVHRDMLYRFNQVESLGMKMLADLERQWFGAGLRIADGPNPVDRLVVMNPLPFARQELVEADLPFDPEYRHRFSEPFGYEAINAFRILDPSGREIPFAIRSIRRGDVLRGIGDSLLRADIIRVAFPCDLPPLAPAECRIIPSDTPVRYSGSLLESPTTIDNSRIRLEVEPGGTFRLTDHETGRVFPGLLSYLDDSEIGDGWNHVAAVGSPVRTTAGQPHSLEIRLDSPFRAELAVIREWTIPAGMIRTERGITTASETGSLRIETLVGVSADSREMDIRIRIDNRACDHRLRVVLPTGIAEPEYWTGQAYTFLRRLCGVRPDTHDFKEKDPLEKQTSGILFKRDRDGQGLAVLCGFGLHECGAPEGPDGLLYLTLLRSFSNTFGTNGEPDGQEPGLHEYRMIVAPLDPSIAPWQLQRRQDCLFTGVRTAVAPAGARERVFGPPGSPPALVVEGPVCASALKPAEDGQGFVVRLYNPANMLAEGTLLPGPGLNVQEALRLDEESREDEGRVRFGCGSAGTVFRIAPQVVATFRIGEGRAP